MNIEHYFLTIAATLIFVLIGLGFLSSSDRMVAVSLAHLSAFEQHPEK